MEKYGLWSRGSSSAVVGAIMEVPSSSVCTEARGVFSSTPRVTPARVLPRVSILSESLGHEAEQCPLKRKEEAGSKPVYIYVPRPKGLVEPSAGSWVRGRAFVSMAPSWGAVAQFFEGSKGVKDPLLGLPAINASLGGVEMAIKC
ncbi:hypothetical protein Salat_1094900 [Sesamum alatum]|uniref:Uncharacterized protein n=1 Tax=Sesamum alatum TaxID=300844 RepID=A0AAE2CSV6_9LAMI|nr:hypothetical protein Salat_1094900 [Sesamum alatum]